MVGMIFGLLFFLLGLIGVLLLGTCIIILIGIVIRIVTGKDNHITEWLDEYL